MSRFVEVLSRVSFPGFAFRVVENDGWAYMQVECNGTDNVTGEPLAWKGRKWLLSPHMTDGEIVQTAFKATLTALEHEAREQFKYRGVLVFDPHYDIEALVALRNQPEAIKTRESVKAEAANG